MLRLILLATTFFASLAPALAASSAARAYVGTLRLNSSDTSPRTDNVLPYFRFLSAGDEGSVGIDLRQPPSGLQPKPASLGTSLPDYLIDPRHGLPGTLGKVLPWRLKDGWTSSRRPMDAKVATLENVHLRVDVMPLWGGHVHRALHKRSGRHLCFFNDEHQPVNDGDDARRNPMELAAEPARARSLHSEPSLRGQAADRARRRACWL